MQPAFSGVCKTFPPVLALLFIFLGFCGSAYSGENGDDLFDGQIRSLTQPKEPLTPSNDPRFRDNSDGTVTDLKEGLMWKKSDSYQELKKWINWAKAQDYIREMNDKRFAGYADWVLPTREELASLYEEDKVIPWNYYWTENQVHMDPIFGYTSCCFWTSETYKDEYAWHFNFIRGKSYPSLKEGQSLSLSVIRPVRKVQAGASAFNK